MKRILIVVLFSCSFICKAQNLDYYTGKTTVTTANGSVYSIKINDYSIKIESNANRYMNAPIKHKDGTIAVAESAVNATPNDTNNTLLNKSFTDVLSSDVVRAMKNDDPNIRLGFVIEPNGRISEVFFRMRNTPAMRAIPIDSYAAIERNIKQNVTFTLDNFTRNTYQRISSFCFLKVNNL